MNLWGVLLVSLTLFLLYQGYLFLSRYSASKILVANDKPFFIERGSGLRLLVVGDSTAVGVGASKKDTTIAGLFARDPNISIENRSVSGAKLSDTLMQLKGAREEKYALVLIQAGANDVINFVPYKEVEKNTLELLKVAKEKSVYAVMLSAGNVGLAPIFPYPYSRLITLRTKAVQEIIRQEAKRQGVAYVELFAERGEDVFEKDEKRYYAADGLHLRDDGYAYWYQEIRKGIKSELDPSESFLK